MNRQDISNDDYDRHWNILWNIQLGIRYHMHMQNFYSRFGKFVTVFTLILSTSSGASLIATHTEIAKYLAFAAALLQTLELVIDSKAKTILHTTLRQRYILLGSELAINNYLKQSDEASFKAKLASIEIDEPPIVFALMDQCNNELVKVHNLGESYYQKLSCLNKIKAWWYN